MAVVNNVKEVLHRIRAKLYPNYLPNAEGKYLARTVAEKSLHVEEVCAALKNRGGYTGNYEDLLDNIRQFFDEAAYQLCDGYAVNMKYFTVYPNIKGTFNSAQDIHDHQKHPIDFRFRANTSLRRLAEEINVVIDGIADVSGWIDTFTDVEADSVNHIATSGNQFIIQGHKIKVAGDDPSVGVYIYPVDDPHSPTNRIKVTRIAENTQSKIIGIIPQTPSSLMGLDIVTQFSGSSNTLLKTPRTITANFHLEEP